MPLVESIQEISTLALMVQTNVIRMTIVIR